MKLIVFLLRLVEHGDLDGLLQRSRGRLRKRAGFWRIARRVTLLVFRETFPNGKDRVHDDGIDPLHDLAL
jgi:hypothetical protein